MITIATLMTLIFADIPHAPSAKIRVISVAILAWNHATDLRWREVFGKHC